MAGAARPGGLPRAARRDRQPDRAAHGGRPGRDPHPAAWSASAPRSAAAHGSRSKRPGITPTSTCAWWATSARARKGSSWDHVRRLIIDADPSLEPRILTGLSSGEGVIWAVRDPTAQDPGTHRSATARDRARIRLRPEGLKPRDLDPVTDTTLRLGRPAAGDPDPHRPARASTAHIALIGHITQHELRRHTTSLELPTATSTGCC